MPSTQRFARLLLLPERTARVVAEWVEERAKEELGDKAYDPSPEARERYYATACSFAKPEMLVPILAERLGGPWTPDVIATLLGKVGFLDAKE